MSLRQVESAEVDLRATLTRSALLDPGLALLRLRLLASSGAKSAPRRPCNLALVLDRSASMTGAPLRATVAAAEAAVKRLDQRDRLTVVVFDARARTLAEVEPMFPAAREALLHRLRGARPGRGTDIGGAIRKALEVQGRLMLKGAIPRLLLLTDGEPSSGAQTGDQLLGVVDDARAAGLTLSCAGVGGSYDAALLRRMAERGGGTFHHLPGPEAIEPFLMREIDGVCHASASSLALEIDPADGVDELHLLAGLPSRRERGCLIVEVGEVVANTQRSVLLRALASDAAHLGVGMSFVDHRGLPQRVGAVPVSLVHDPEASQAADSEWLALRLADYLDRAWNRSVHNHISTALEDLDHAGRTAARAKRKGIAPPVELMQRLALARELIASGDADARDEARRHSEMISHFTRSGLPPLKPH